MGGGTGRHRTRREEIARRVLDGAFPAKHDDHHPMRYPDGHNEEVRARIVDVAARALRRDGIDAVSIPKIMKLAGLTHGGFYVHFKDRDELVAAVIERTTRDGAFTGDGTLEECVGRYLSKAHVEHPEMGCIVAALGFEGTRQTGKVRRAFAEAARRLLQRVDRKLHPKAEVTAPSDEALQKAAQMVGAVVLARLVQDEGLAERLLATAKKQVGA
jgi:TetR/AcrR family transcriptional repressor of nem operon